MNLTCLNDKTILTFNEDEKKYSCSRCNAVYPVVDGVTIFLNKKDEFYEGVYDNNLATIKYVPKGKSFFAKLPLWMINSGYPWYVDKYVPEASTILELGCGGGVKFFGKNYNTIGLDLSHRSLKNIAGIYSMCLMADALKIPFEDESVDAVVSAYFWEHIPPALKPPMLIECKRILKPGGKLIFLYDIETKNILINQLKKKNLKLYKELFLEKDGHIGYQTFQENKKIFEDNGFKSIKHIGFEKTIVQSNSVYPKLVGLGGLTGLYSRIGMLLNKSYLFYVYNLFIRVIDSTAGKLFPIDHSRIMMSILKKYDNKLTKQGA